MLEGVDLRYVLMYAGLTFRTGFSWLVGLVMGAGAVLLLAPISGHEVQAALQRVLKKQQEEQVV